MWRKPTEVSPSLQPSTSSASDLSRTQELAKTSAFQSPYQPTPSSPLNASPAPASSNISKIGSGLKIQGELSGNSDVYIDGDVQGKIRLTNARVTVGPNGCVQAEIEARDIVVDGSVQGNLKASESARLGSSSRIVGGVLSPRIAIEDGARLRGKVETVRVPQTPKASAVESASESDEFSPVTIGVKSE